MEDRTEAGDHRNNDLTPPRRSSYPQQYPQQYPQYAALPPVKRSRAPIVFTGIGSLVLGLLVGYAAGHGAKTTKTAPSATVVVSTIGGGPAAPNSPSTAKPEAPSTTEAAPKTAPPAKVGGTIALTGMRGDEKLTVTLVKMADPATSSDQYMHADSGKHLVAVQIRITNTATTAYSDSPTNGATLIDAKGQQYSSSFGETTLGQPFNGSVKLSPGATALGVVVYEVPDGEKATTFQFSLDSGFADQTGQWQLS